MTEGLVRFADSWDSARLRLASWDSRLRRSLGGGRAAAAIAHSMGLRSAGRTARAPTRREAPSPTAVNSPTAA